MATTPVGVDAAQLRRSIYDKRAATRTDLVGLMALGPECRSDPDYLALVRDVARDVMTPALDDEDADWLVARLGDGAGLGSRAEFEALKAVLHHSARAPSSLVAFAVREIERAILTGRREAIGGPDSETAVVAAQDVEALREVCAVDNVDRAVNVVGRATAEALFDIAHATATARNDAGFAPFFAKTIGAFLLAATAAPVGANGTLAGLLLSLQSASKAPPVEQLAEDAYLSETAEAEARLRAAAEIDLGDAKWVFAHLARGGPLSEAEERLLGFLGARAVRARRDQAA